MCWWKTKDLLPSLEKINNTGASDFDKKIPVKDSLFDLVFLDLMIFLGIKTNLPQLLKFPD